VALSGARPRRRVLVLRALGLGDLLTAVPAMRAVRAAYAGDEVVLATPASLTPLVELAGVADRVLDVRGVRSLPHAVAWEGPPPELAVNLHGRGPQSHRLLLATGARELLGFRCPGVGPTGSRPAPAWREEEHEVRRWCRLLAEGAGLAADPTDLRLPPPGVESPAPGAVVVHPGAAYPSRRWPPERFGDVARDLAERGLPVVVTGGPDEVHLAEGVRRRAGLPPESVLAGRTGLAELAALVAGARLLVCGDTGVAHLATAYATPSVLLFGPTPASRWGPVTDGPHVVLHRSPTTQGGSWSGDPWGQQVDPALLRITVEDVLAAAVSPALRTTPGSA